MDTEVLLKIVEGSSAITLLTIGILYLLAQRRQRRNGNNNNNVDHSAYVTQVEFNVTVLESRRLNDQKHAELTELLSSFNDDVKLDRQNLFDHISTHND